MTVSNLTLIVKPELVAAVEDLKTLKAEAAIAVTIHSESGELLDVRVLILPVEEMA
jgi:hypothetical protein